VKSFLIFEDFDRRSICQDKPFNKNTLHALVGGLDFKGQAQLNECICWKEVAIISCFMKFFPSVVGWVLAAFPVLLPASWRGSPAIHLQLTEACTCVFIRPLITFGVPRGFSQAFRLRKSTA